MIFRHSWSSITSLGIAEVVFPTKENEDADLYHNIASRCPKSPIRFANFASEGSMATLTLT